MKNSFGPWGTALDFGPNPQLSAFWKRRMAMLVPTSRSRRRVSRPSALCLIVAAVVVCAFPTLRDSPALAEENEGTSPPVSKQREKPELPKEVTSSIGMKLRLIPAGQFMMGSTEEGDPPVPLPEESIRRADESPVHKVRITKPFYLGVHEVTQAQWEAVMGTSAKSMYVGTYDPKLFHPDYPVFHVTWYDAVAFCNKLSQAEGRTPAYRIESPEKSKWSSSIGKATVTITGGDGYRLPTEAEWEFACRAGTRTSYAFGERLTDQDAHVGRGYQAVGTHRANAWGLHDMHGNVWEWCQDWYHEKYYERSPASDPAGPSSGTRRVIRGGGQTFVGWCRSANRTGNSPDSDTDFIGFRVALPAAE